jgi:SAM-dependent methyltransferase
MSNEIRNCPACESSKRKRLGRKNAFEVFSCARCKTLYTGHIPAAEGSQNYDEYYSAANLSVPDFVRRRVGEIVEEFAGYKRSNRLLDVGFGAGTILEAASEQGWSSFGLEVSKPAVDHGRKLGFEVFHGGLRDAGYPDGHFDVVTASEIIEHLPDPMADLREIVRILRPGGLFWGTTPSARSLSYRLLKLNWSVLSPPEHTQLYSGKGAAIVLKKAGFSRISFKTFGLNPAEIVDHFRSRNQRRSFDRVSTAYDLNEKLTRNRSGQVIKSLLNQSLNIVGVGDSLKIYATK